MGIRVAIVDDNPHVPWAGRVHPVNATFHRFLSAVLDVEGAPVAEIVHCVPLQDALEAPRTLALDSRIRVVGTEAFEGIAGYVRRAPAILRANRPILRTAFRDADLLWLKLPASNALLAAALARRAGVPRFGYVAGSARAVARGRWRGARGIGAQAVGLAWDVAGRLATLGGDRVVVGHDVITSLVEPGELRDPAARPWPWEPGRLRLAWAGRLVRGKGLETVVEALVELPPASLLVLGDGPAIDDLRGRATRLGVDGRIDWHGYVADRGAYLDALARADVFVFPSPAEGFPKAVLDAMAVGLPVVASPTGQLAPLAAGGIVAAAPAGDPAALGGIVGALAAAPGDVERLRRAGATFAGAHTRAAEATRLVERWRRRWPELPWE